MIRNLKTKAMPMRYRRRVVTAVLFGLGVLTGSTHAGIVGGTAFLLGFDLQGNRNPLSGGIDFLATKNFVGNPLSFGPADLTLQGPLSFSVSTGKRGLSQFDVRLSTAVDGNAAASPLNYVFNADVGGQATQVSGNLLMDADLSLNQFGFYDLKVVYSSRQNVVSNGRFANDSQDFDADVGPINISGNVFADLLSLLTDPLFQQAGVSNPFTSFSGISSLAAAVSDQATITQKSLAFGVDPVAGQRAELLAVIPADQIVDAQAAITSKAGRIRAGVVPEPTVWILMLVGLPFVFAQRRRRKAG